jgi:hypothetical protein
LGRIKSVRDCGGVRNDGRSRIPRIERSSVKR